MTIQECYEKMHGNYADVLGRFQMEKLVERFMLKYLEDATMQLLIDSVASGNIQESFRAAHTLKGVAANLGFTELQKTASELTEQLRPCTEQADPELFNKVKAASELVVSTLNEYKTQA